MLKKPHWGSQFESRCGHLLVSSKLDGDKPKREKRRREKGRESGGMEDMRQNPA